MTIRTYLRRQLNFSFKNCDSITTENLITVEWLTKKIQDLHIIPENAPVGSRLMPTTLKERGTKLIVKSLLVITHKKTFFQKKALLEVF